MQCNTITISASRVPIEDVEWLDIKAKAQSTKRSTIIRQIIAQRIADEANQLDAASSVNSQGKEAQS